MKSMRRFCRKHATRLVEVLSIPQAHYKQSSWPISLQFVSKRMKCQLFHPFTIIGWILSPLGKQLFLHLNKLLMQRNTLFFWLSYFCSQGKGDSFASDFLPYLFWVLASSLCPRKTLMPSWWTPLTTAMGQWQHMTTNFPQPVRAAAPRMPTTLVPLLPPPIAPPPYLGLWITPHPRVPGTGYTRTRLWPRPSIRAKRTRLMQLHLSQVLHRLPLERVCAVSAGPPLCTTWKGLDPTPKWCSGTDMPVKVWFIQTVALAKHLHLHAAQLNVKNTMEKFKMYPHTLTNGNKFKKQTIYFAHLCIIHE